MQKYETSPRMRTFAAALMAACAVLIFTRVMLRGFGVEPDTGVVTGTHWQHLPLDQLNAGLFDALVNLHSQPPLWNLILGAFAKMCDADAACVTHMGHVFNMGLTLAGAALVFAALRLLNVRARLAGVAAAIYPALPSVMFYETYVFYPHFASVLFLAQGCALLWAVKTASRASFALAFGCAAALCLTWSLFHPLYIGVVFASLWVALGRAAWRVRVLAPAVAAVIAAAAPSVKNHVHFGIAANGSWMGFNLAQVAPSLSGEAKERCAFETYLKAPLRAGESPHPAMRLNNPDLVLVSKLCAGDAARNILAHPLSYAKGRVLAALQSLSAPSHKYFFTPVNWDRVDVAPDLGIRGADGRLNVVALAYRGGLLSFYLLTFAFAAVLLCVADRGARAGIAVLLIPSACFLVLAHALNGHEQNRMRHTVEMSIWLLAFFCVARADAFRLFARRAPEPVSAPAHASAHRL